MQYFSCNHYEQAVPTILQKNGVCSDTKDIRCGVPQGSCLGPFLFLIYISDFPFSLKKVKVTMYADDTSISHSSLSLDDVNQTLNSELSHLKQWLLGNKLSLNILKTQVLVVGSQPKIKRIVNKTVDHPQFFIGDSQVENVDRVNVVSRAIGCLKYVRKFLPQNTLSKIYRGIVEPHFRCYCSVWGCCWENKLQTPQ